MDREQPISVLHGDGANLLDYVPTDGSFVADDRGRAYAKRVIAELDHALRPNGACMQAAIALTVEHMGDSGAGFDSAFDRHAIEGHIDACDDCAKRANGWAANN